MAWCSASSPASTILINNREIAEPLKTEKNLYERTYEELWETSYSSIRKYMVQELRIPSSLHISIPEPAQHMTIKSQS